MYIHTYTYVDLSYFCFKLDCHYYSLQSSRLNKTVCDFLYQLDFCMFCDQHICCLKQEGLTIKLVRNTQSNGNILHCLEDVWIPETTTLMGDISSLALGFFLKHMSFGKSIIWSVRITSSKLYYMNLKIGRFYLSVLFFWCFKAGFIK